MTKNFYKSFIISILLLVNLTVFSEANYYLEMKKIDRKVYVAAKQQELLSKTLQVGKNRGNSKAWIKAYKKKISEIHRDEVYYRSQRVQIQKEVWKIEQRERGFERRLSSFPGDIYINIDKSQQIMDVYKGDQLIYSWLCSTGKAGYVTPYGDFKPYHTVKMHYSKQWDNSPMPYSVFFHHGFAIHGTNYVRSLGSRASHGCVRLSKKNAKKIYNLARKYGYKRVHINIA